jgi:hypothetical protein
MSKEKQIEEMARLICEGCADHGDCKYDICDMILDEANRLYNAGYRKQSEWISVEERLPELNGNIRTWGELKIQPSVRVLCACKQKSGRVFVKEGFYEMWGSSVVWKIPGSIDSVTHWMPLPEAPKMKGGAE